MNGLVVVQVDVTEAEWHIFFATSVVNTSIRNDGTVRHVGRCDRRGFLKRASVTEDCGTLVRNGIDGSATGVVVISHDRSCDWRHWSRRPWPARRVVKSRISLLRPCVLSGASSVSRIKPILRRVGQAGRARRYLRSDHSRQHIERKATHYSSANSASATSNSESGKSTSNSYR